MAVVFAYLLKRRNPEIQIHMVVTYGQPRFGNMKFIDMINLMGLNYLRFVNSGDYIADVPPPLGKSDWSHCGESYLFNEGKIELLNSEYEKGLARRIALVALSAWQLWRTNNWKKEEISKISSKHKMQLYVNNIEATLQN